MYFNTNMFEPLAANIDNSGKVDTLLKIYVADDVALHSEKLASLTLRLLLSDLAAASLPPDRRLESTVVATIGHSDDGIRNIPPEKRIGSQVEVRLNNLLFPEPTAEGAWLVFEAEPRAFAVGENLVGIRMTERSEEVSQEICIEKLEVHVRYDDTATATLGMRSDPGFPFR